MIDFGVDIGPGILVDACKLTLVATAMGYEDKRISKELLADLIVSSLILPQLGSITPILKSEIILTEYSRKLEHVENLLNNIIDVFGEQSRSSMYVEVLRLELPLQTTS